MSACPVPLWFRAYVKPHLVDQGKGENGDDGKNE